MFDRFKGVAGGASLLCVGNAKITVRKCYLINVRPNLHFRTCLTTRLRGLACCRMVILNARLIEPEMRRAAAHRLRNQDCLCPFRAFAVSR